jgi:pimeloyl-ACP methyl ester carboxylesterase
MARELGSVRYMAWTVARWLKRRMMPLGNLVGGSERWYPWRGYRVAYTVRGNGPALLLVHGIYAAASAYEWRRVVDALAARHTVYTIDLLGFGRSDRPAVRYTPRLYVELVSDFLHDVAAPCAVIASGLGAAYAIAAAACHPERISALALVEPTGYTRAARNIGRWGDLLRLPLVAMYELETSRAALKRDLAASYAYTATVSDETVDHLYRSAHQPGARHAPTAFLARQLSLDLKHIWPALGAPTLLIWGAHPHLTRLADLRAFRAARPATDAAIIEGAGDLPHDECPTDFVDVVTAFLNGVRQDSLALPS